MIFIAAAVLALTLSKTETPLRHSTTATEQIPASRSEANPSPYPVLDVPVGEFDAVKVSGAMKVFVVAGAEKSGVTLQGPRALIEDTLVEVENGTLTIRFREGANWSWNPGSGLSVGIQTPKLFTIDIEGPSQVEVLQPQGQSFAASTEGAGSINITGLDVENVLLATKGASIITASGSAREANYSLGGSGSIDAMRLRVTNANISIGSSGSSYANVSGEARISLKKRTAGRVEVVGGANCISQPANSDRVECR